MELLTVKEKIDNILTDATCSPEEGLYESPILATGLKERLENMLSEDRRVEHYSVKCVYTEENAGDAILSIAWVEDGELEHQLIPFELYGVEL